MGNGKGPKAKSKLLEITGESDFELACNGWELQDVVKTEDDEEIENECTICGQTHLNDNYLICYIKNGVVANIGSSCIKRFIRFKDIGSQEDSNRYFEKKKREINDIKSTRELLLEVLMDKPQSKYVLKFRSICANILQIKPDEFKGLYLSEQWFKLLSILNKNFLLTEKQEHRVKLILFNPRDVEVTKGKVRIDKPIYNGKIRHRVSNTLSKSGVYKNPSQIFGGSQ
ncbi:MAG TPA: hypothetical protein DDW50_21050 [Firmicutes bacterium]|jgi:hypothetical protein|nr:hypothetical protein [Bacillota bacterium]